MPFGTLLPRASASAAMLERARAATLSAKIDVFLPGLAEDSRGVGGAMSNATLDTVAKVMSEAE